MNVFKVPSGGAISTCSTVTEETPILIGNLRAAEQVRCLYLLPKVRTAACILREGRIVHLCEAWLLLQSPLRSGSVDFLFVFYFEHISVAELNGESGGQGPRCEDPYHMRHTRDSRCHPERQGAFQWPGFRIRRNQILIPLNS